MISSLPVLKATLIYAFKNVIFDRMKCQYQNSEQKLELWILKKHSGLIISHYIKMVLFIQS